MRPQSWSFTDHVARVTSTGLAEIFSGGLMGAEVVVEGLTKSFGRQNIWRDVTLTLPPGEVSARARSEWRRRSVSIRLKT